MKLRIILLVLSLLAFLSASTGGYLYYLSLKESAFEDADRKVALDGERIKNHLSSFLSEYLKSAKALSGMKELQQVLLDVHDESLARANSILDHFHDSLNVGVCYLMAHDGYTIASSNRNASDSFVGKNYAFRPYFQQAIQGMPSIYMALGVTSKKRGVYYSHPVYGKRDDRPVGVVVIKASIDSIEKDFTKTYEGIVLLTDPNGIVFISNRNDWLYHSLWKLPPEKDSQLAMTQQFGKGPWGWTGMVRKDSTHAVDKAGNEYLIRQITLDNYPGWKIILMRSLREVSKKFLVPLMRTTG
ncbi:MAG TPA: cache domain-containing protein, partial [Candidatus Bathyarchaeia archaeon]|nr:cache domain-containing protein [Candidatus Bathyarchaeia archaeon]